MRGIRDLFHPLGDVIASNLVSLIVHKYLNLWWTNGFGQQLC